MKQLFLTILSAGCTLLAAAQTEWPLYIGTYTGTGSHGIYVAKVDARTGAIRLVDSLAADNPSYLALNKAGNRLYAVTENGGSNPGAASSFMKEEGSGKWVPLNINPQLTGGDHPCYIAVNKAGTHAVVANYTGGSVSVFPLDIAGALEANSQLIQHRGSSVNAARQEKPHVHSTIFSPNEQYLMVADLGTDFLTAYPFNPSKAMAPLDTARALRLKLSPGAGPRHVSFHPKLPIVYVMEELSGKVAVVRFAPQQRQLQVLQTIQSDRISKQPGSADIHLSPDGKFLYASNRIDANDIAVFAVDARSGQLRFVQSIGTGGIKPRNFTLSPDGKFVLVANQQSNNIVLFHRNAVTGKLTAANQSFSLPSPVCLVFGQ